MSPELQPKDILATLEQGGVRYELAGIAKDDRVCVSCVEPGGMLRWRRMLDTHGMLARSGEMRLERRGLVAIARGNYAKFPDRATEGRMYVLSPVGDLVDSEFETLPQKTLATLEHEGRRYEIAETKNRSFGVLTCLGPGAAVLWRRKLSLGSVELEEAKLALDAGKLAVDAFGSHCKGGEWCRVPFVVTLDGEIVREDGIEFLK